MMISRRNFAMLTAIMLVVLFMFQATGIAKNRLNHAQTNEYALENRTDMQSENAFSPDAETDRRVLFVADEKTSSVAATVREWCTYSKRGLVMVENVEDCAPYLNSAEVLLVDSTALDFDRDVVVLQGYVDQGVSVIFCNLPDVTVVGNHVELEELLGIRGIYNPQVKLTGIQLFDGFLLGGMQIYKAEKPEEQELQDMDLTVPWYLTVNGNTAYMVGLVDDLKSQDGEVENEYAPGLIWRYSGRNGSVFVVNGDFLEDVTGIGILEAMMYELHDYELYPIVNAQNLSVANYPSFANENSQEIQKRYSRELPSLYRDVIWQSMSSVTERNRSKTTMLLAPQYDYTDENERLVYREMRRQIKHALSCGHTVIADALFYSPHERKKMEQLAKRLNVPFDGFWMTASLKTRLERVQIRKNNPSDIKTQQALQKQISQSTGVIWWRVIDTEGPKEQTLLKIRKYVKKYL